LYIRIMISVFLNAMNCSKTTCSRFYVANEVHTDLQERCCDFNWRAGFFIVALGFMWLSVAICLCITRKHRLGSESGKIMPRMSTPEELDISIRRGQPPNSPALSRQTSLF